MSDPTANNTELILSELHVASKKSGPGWIQQHDHQGDGIAHDSRARGQRRVLAIHRPTARLDQVR